MRKDEEYDLESKAEVVDLFEYKSEKTLYYGFEEFRQRKIAQNRRAMQMAKSKNRTREQLDALRQYFIYGALHYLGVPYRRAEHPEGSELRNYYIELDCCGLVRQVCYDMENELGFHPLLYNQAYYFDTLPKRYDSADRIRPGDLIFYAGTYFDSKKRPQKHNMVHVEIYYGDHEHPERCIGSRFRRGVVSIFDSYKFDSTAWKLEKMWFCSIDTWLDGMCHSDCPIHQWDEGRSTHVRGSIFEPIEQQDQEANQGEY